MATANDKLQDESIAHAIWVSRYSTGVANRMIKVLNDSDAELTARLLVAIDTLDRELYRFASGSVTGQCQGHKQGCHTVHVCSPLYRAAGAGEA